MSNKTRLETNFDSCVESRADAARRGHGIVAATCDHVVVLGIDTPVDAAAHNGDKSRVCYVSSSVRGGARTTILALT